MELGLIEGRVRVRGQGSKFVLDARVTCYC